MRFLNKKMASSLTLLAALVFFISSLAVSQGQQQKPAPAEGKTVLDIVTDNEDTKHFADALEKSGFARVLKQQGPYTVVAPKNKAVEEAELNIEENPKNLIQGQLYQGEIPAEEIESQLGVTIEKSDKSASNGVVYIVDKVSQGR